MAFDSNNMDKKEVFGVLYIIDYLDKLECRKRLQKLVCISKFDKNINYPFSFEFVRGLYGPYSFELKDLMDKLVLSDLISEEIVGGKYIYSLTDRGKDFLKNLKNQVDEKSIKSLNLLLKKYPKKTPLSELVILSKGFYGW